MRPATDTANFNFNMSTDAGSNYNVTKTTTWFGSYHNEADDASGLSYDTGNDLAQSTSFQILMSYNGNSADKGYSGSLQLFNPASTTYVKHFICNGSNVGANDYSNNAFVAGYGNTTSAVDALRFQMSSGNIADGTILLFGIV